MRVSWSIATAALTLMIPLLAEAVPRAAAGVAEPGLRPAWIARGATPEQHAYSALRAAPAAFIARYGGVWFERRGGPTGDFRRAFGEGVALDPAVEVDDAVAIAAVERFFAENEDLMPRGVSPADLELRGTIAWRGKRIVSFTQEVDGVPIEGAVAYAVIVRGRLVLWGMRLFPVAPVETRALVATGDAARTALRALAGRRGAPRISSPARHVLVPLVGDDRLELRPAFAVRITLDGNGTWTAFVDARSGALIVLRDERVRMSGSIGIEHHDRNPGGGLVEGPGAQLDLTANGEDVTTDADGAFTATGDTADVTGNLIGPYVEVQTMTGTDVALSVAGMADGGSHLWISDGSEIEQAQLDAYVFTLAVRDHARSLQDDVPWLDEPLLVRPNQPEMDGMTACNAWSDWDSDTINFLMAGDAGGGYECNNMAMVSDVVYHEYGHGLHFQNLMMGVGTYDYAVGEAFADTMSVALTHDHVLAPYFVTSGEGIRDLEPDMVWPDDFIEPPPEDPYANAHTNGLILGGALWDLRKALVDDLGDEVGHRRTDEIFVDMLRTTDDIPSSYEAALVADDDNGDLADGTPNLCSIYGTFQAHGLTAGGLGLLVIEHEPMWNAAEAGAPIPLSAEVTVPQEECATLGDVRVVYSTDGGASWSEVSMDPEGGDAFAAELPGLAAGATVRYRIEAEEADSGDWITRPTNPAEPYYVTYVGPLTEILCDRFDGEDDGGWTHELLAGEDIEGADDWQRGVPPGKGGDPEAAFSAPNVWGNDLAPEENWNGLYQNDRITTLRSPTWDLSAYETVRLRFRRWLNVEDGYYDHARVYVNEEEVWTNAASPGGSTVEHDTHHKDGEWILADVDLSEVAGGAAAVQIRFEIESDSGLMFGGWNLDDVCLYTADDVDTDAGADGGEPVVDAGGDAGSDASPVSATAHSGCDCDAAGAGRSGGSLLSAILASI